MSKLFHAVAAAQFLFGIYYDLTYVKLPEDSPMSFKGDPVPMKGRLKFLTIWNVLSVTLYFIIALLDDFVPSKDPIRGKSFIRKIKELHFSCIAFPISFLVTSMFWSLYMINREIIFPKSFDDFFPLWLNHVYHSNVLIFMTLELFLNYIDYPPRKLGLTISGLFIFVYCIWVHVMFYNSGRWVYPVLEVLNWPLRIVFYLINLAVVFGCYVIGENLTQFLWPKLTSQKKSLNKKRAN